MTIVADPTAPKFGNLVGPSLIAAAQVLHGTRHQDPKSKRMEWQDEAWDFYDSSGPLRFAATWLANLVSRAELFAAQWQPGQGEPKPLESGPAAETVFQIAGGPHGQAEMLNTSAVQLTVPGTGYLVGEGANAETWTVYSPDVLRLASPATPISAAVFERLTDDGQWAQLPEESLVVRIWRPHKRVYWQADSPARAALGPLRELRRISEYIDATLMSRLAGAGVLTLPQGASFPTAPNEPDNAHPFVTEVIEAMATAVKSPGTPAQIVPIAIEIPADQADAVQHLSFSTELSERILDLRQSALKQAAISLDVPAEVLTGMGEINHWGQWQVEESAVKVHAEPLLQLITGSLTKGLLHPVLQAQGMSKEEAETFAIWADTSSLTTRPDKSDDTFKLYDRGEAAGRVARREAGLAEADKPNEEELREWAFKQMLSSVQLAPLGLRGLGIIDNDTAGDMLAIQARANGSDSEVEADPNQPPPDEDESGASRQGAPEQAAMVVEAYVFRALERATNRIRNRYAQQLGNNDCGADPHVCLGGVQDPDLLADAWDRLVPVLAEMGFDPALGVERINAYCEALLSQGLEYDRATLGRVVLDIPRSETVWP